MADEWPTEPLKCLVDPERAISYGIVQPGTPTVDGVPIVRVTDIRNGRVNTRDPLRVSREIEAAYSRTRLRGGELLLTLVGTVGETAIASKELVGWNTARAVAVIPVRDEVGAYWVRLALQSRAVRHIIDSRLNTTVQATLNLGDVAQLPIVMPPEPQRRAISQILGALDSKLELNRRMSETLEEMARVLFQSWFVNFDPVRAKAAGRNADLPTDLANLFPAGLVDSELGGIPDGWVTGTLGDFLAELEVGGRPKGGVGAYTDGVPSIGAESIVGLGMFDFTKTKYVPHEYFERMTKGHVKDRDVLLYKDGGRPGEFEPHVTLVGDGFPFKRAAINEHVYRMRAKPPLGQAYLYFWLTSAAIMDEMRNKGTGVAIPGLNSTQVRSLTTLVPPASVADKFAELVEPWVTRILGACNQSRTLASLRDTLLPMLISGELRVRDVERLVGAVT